MARLPGGSGGRDQHALCRYRCRIGQSRRGGGDRRRRSRGQTNENTEDAAGYAKLFALLGQAPVALVTMEATGHYWRNLFAALAADGAGTNEIMRRSGKSKTAVWRWQERFV